VSESGADAAAKKNEQIRLQSSVLSVAGAAGRTMLPPTLNERPAGVISLAAVAGDSIPLDTPEIRAVAFPVNAPMRIQLPRNRR
jgi:hypothetical protein